MFEGVCLVLCTRVCVFSGCLCACTLFQVRAKGG
jgi:hypothetical protein